MNGDQNKLDSPQEGEIVLTTIPETVQEGVENETPTDLLARLHQQEDSRIEPDNEDG